MKTILLICGAVVLGSVILFSITMRNREKQNNIQQNQASMNEWRDTEDRSQRARNDPHPMVGEIAPTFKLRSFDNESETDLASFQGRIPVVLVFGSYTWPPFLSQVGSLEKMYQEYKDIAEFRMVYIREAHAIDSTAPHESAREKGILNHRNTEQRCATAQMLIDDKSLTIPTLVDGMDDAVNKAYRAHPDRIFVVRTDGRLGAAAKRGPGGFVEGLEDAQKWLAELRNTGQEPEIPKEKLEAAMEYEAVQR